MKFTLQLMRTQLIIKILINSNLLHLEMLEMLET